MKLPVIVFACMIFLLGVFAKPLLGIIENAAGGIL
mgnify:FL=1